MSQNLTVSVDWPSDTTALFGESNTASFNVIVNDTGAEFAILKLGIYNVGFGSVSTQEFALDNDSNEIGGARTRIASQQFDTVIDGLDVSYSITEDDVRSLPGFNDNEITVNLGYKVTLVYENDNNNLIIEKGVNEDGTLETWVGKDTGAGRNRTNTVDRPQQQFSQEEEDEQAGADPTRIPHEAQLVEGFKIRNIRVNELFYDGNDIQDKDTIEFEEEENISINNPMIAIDSSSRFATHEIIGGGVVRQKIGQDPLEVTINGVCFAETAKKIDALRYATYGRIYSDRFPNGVPGENSSFLDVHFASASTEPLVEGDAINIEKKKRLYSYTLNCVEVN
jgi:hypothetical protein